MPLAGLLVWFLGLLKGAIIVHVILSWVRLPEDNPFVVALNVVCEPLLGPIRRVLPSVSGLDFSPFAAIIILHLLQGFVRGMA